MAYMISTALIFLELKRCVLGKQQITIRVVSVWFNLDKRKVTPSLVRVRMNHLYDK